MVTFPLSFYGIPIMLAAAFIIPLVSLKKEKMVPYIGVSACLASFFLAALTFIDVLEFGILTHQMEGWPAPFGITIAVDNLSMFLVFMINFIGFAALAFSTKFIKERRTKYYSLLCLVLVGLLGIAHTGDIFNMFVFFEIMSISSYALTSYYRNRDSIEAAMKYIIMGSIATSIILFGIAFIYSAAGSLNMADLALRIPAAAGPVLPLGLGLLLAGFLFKAAIFPFHAWKPDVASVIPVPFATLLATAGSAIGIYAMLRIAFTVFSLTGFWLHISLIVMGVFSMVFGAVLALQQYNILRLLAYSSISQMGFVVMSLGIGSVNALGYTAGIFHLFNIMVFDALLFLCAGIIVYHAGTADMRKLGGFGSFNPILFYSFVIAMLSSVGIPLFNGFSSKILIYIATLQTYPVLTVISLLVSVLTLGYMLKVYDLVFLGGKKISPGRIHRSMWIPMAVLAAVCLFFGVLPNLGMAISDAIASNLSNAMYIMGVLG